MGERVLLWYVHTHMCGYVSLHMCGSQVRTLCVSSVTLCIIALKQALSLKLELDWGPASLSNPSVSTRL